MSSPLSESIDRELPFIHLHVHSSYSLLESSIRINSLISYAQKEQMPAIALTDKHNLFGALEFSESCLKNGIQPIIGGEFYVEFSRKWETHSALNSLLLLAANEEGYYNLMRLASLAYNEKDSRAQLNFSQKPYIALDSLIKYKAGLIILTSGQDGALISPLKAGAKQLARERALCLQEHFADRLYIELQRYAGYAVNIEQDLLELAYDLELPLVATNPAHFLKEADYKAHKVLRAIADGGDIDSQREFIVPPDFYLKSSAQMRELFADLPEALANSAHIARRCSAISPLRAPILPRFSSDENVDLKQRAHDGLRERLVKRGVARGHAEQEYWQRLDYELEIISSMKFAGYFLIVAEFIQWAKAQAIPVGPGRGSGAGSLVAYALTITDIDPLRFSLLFERFLNPERVSMPDFDIDFCPHGRDRVIEHVKELYQADRVAQIITFGTLQARGVLRDVGRALGMPYGQVDRICKQIPFETSGQNMLKDILRRPELQSFLADNDPNVAELYMIAPELEGLYRHAATHAAGIVIGDRDLCELVPLYRDPRSAMQITQFNMKYVEKAGLVKFDFLGLKTLSILNEALALIPSAIAKPDLENLPLDDAKTYELLSRADSLGVFQLESAGMRKTLMEMRPDSIEDLIALVALYRPGPMDNIPLYNKRKAGELPIASIHEKIDHLLKETQGVIVYQEQVMQIAQVLAGYSLGEADILRRAMGKKLASEMAAQRQRFVSGAVANGVAKHKALEIFDLLARFADYGFNKSHAAAYALLAYQTAYLKAHFPAQFLAASMSYDINNSEKLTEFREEALRAKIEVCSPSVNSSYDKFMVKGNIIYYALSAIKGVGQDAAKHIVEKRKDKVFKDLADFFSRIDIKQVNKRAMEGLIYAGALDCLGARREVILANLDDLNKWSATRQMDIKDHLFIADQNMVRLLRLKHKPRAWSEEEKLEHEVKSLGFYLSGHPLDKYRAILQRSDLTNYRALKQAGVGRDSALIAGTLVSKKMKRAKNGKRMAFCSFTDQTGTYEIVVFSDLLEKYEAKLIPSQSFFLKVRSEAMAEDIRLTLISLHALDDMVSNSYRRMVISLSPDAEIDFLSQLLAPYANGGSGEIILSIKPSARQANAQANADAAAEANAQAKAQANSKERLDSNSDAGSALLAPEQPMGLQEAIWLHLGANYKLGVKLEQQLAAQPCVEKIERY